jgi:hypothetical protein
MALAIDSRNSPELQNQRHRDDAGISGAKARTDRPGLDKMLKERYPTSLLEIMHR